jgi:hypothetical protein
MKRKARDDCGETGDMADIESLESWPYGRVTRRKGVDAEVSREIWQVSCSGWKGPE